MKGITSVLLVTLMVLQTGVKADVDIHTEYEPTLAHPYGRPNPAAPPEARLFDFMIGRNECVQQRFDYKTGEGHTSTSIWTNYFTFNGWGIRDEYYHNLGSAVTLRLYDPTEKVWRANFFLAQNRFYKGEWIGGLQGDRIVLEMDDIFEDRLVISRLTYFNITPNSFDWQSENIDKENGEIFIDWKISCKKSIRKIFNSQ